MLVRVAIFAFVGLLAFLYLRRLLAKLTRREAVPPGWKSGVSQLVQDPNCGVYIDRANAVFRKVPGGFLFFCSTRCADQHLSAKRGGAPS
jgi:YHS domain-containing protein